MAGVDGIESIAAAQGWVGLARGPDNSERFPYVLAAWGLSAAGKYGKRMVGLVWFPGDGMLNIEDWDGFAGYEYHGPDAHTVGRR
jgi:hypothetical protein